MIQITLCIAVLIIISLFCVFKCKIIILDVSQNRLNIIMVNSLRREQLHTLHEQNIKTMHNPIQELIYIIHYMEEKYKNEIKSDLVENLICMSQG